MQTRMDPDKLFALDPMVLFRQAQEKAARREKLTCSPVTVVGDCRTRPICRHCRWENLRAIDPSFLRKRNEEEILARTQVLVAAGVRRAFMPSGWMGYDLPDYFADFVRVVKENSNLEVYGLFGAINRSSLLRLQAAGMDGFFCGIESPNEAVYRSFRPGGDSLEDRKETILAASEIGLKVWSGFLVGLGETQEDIYAALAFFDEAGVDSLSILPFTPFPHTQMWGKDAVNPLYWARVVAVTRMALDKPDIFSPQEGFYADYGRLAGINGSYVFPPGKF